MKIGMIFECGPQGADKKVCEKFARQIKPDIQIVSVTLDNKPNLVASCGRVAAQLIKQDCIEPELEEWFLYDLTALSSVLSTTAHPVTIRKSPNGGTNPKKTLTKLFEENTGKKYNDLIHADIIAKNISKFDKIAKKCPSFERFVQKIT